jgi:hypothetical protein
MDLKVQPHSTTTQTLRQCLPPATRFSDDPRLYKLGGDVILPPWR